VRGKAGRPYEFGPKIAVSKVNGFIHLDEISFDNGVNLEPSRT